MQPSFRTKLILIVGTTTAAFMLVTIGGFSISARQARDLRDVEGRLVPRLEIGPRLEAQFEKLRQELQNAVSAQDSKALAQTAALKDELIDRLATAGTAIDPGEAARLRWSISEYYGVASDVSRRLIRGEAGDELLGAVAKMQAEQQKTHELLQHATRLDRRELSAGFAAIRGATDKAQRFYLVIGGAAIALVVLLSYWLSRGTLRTLGLLSSGFERFAAGDFNHRIPVIASDELGSVAMEANRMAESLRGHAEERDRRDWVRVGQAELSDELRSGLNSTDIARRVITYLVRRLRALAGAMYAADEDGVLRLRSHEGLALPSVTQVVEGFRVGEGLVGRAAQTNEILVVEDPPEGYLRIRSALGESPPRAIVLVPLARLGKLAGVFEIALFEPCSDTGLELLSSVREVIAATLLAAQSRAALEELLEETRQQAERLVAQEEELRLSNQTLQSQQESLRSANEQLGSRQRALAEKNDQLEDARERIQEKADELSRVSSYKSQFLANMSHELRTPLNSMLLLSQLLAENDAENLTPKQVEHCKTIHSAGVDLLALINQVLDLAKIEAGKQDVLQQSVELEDLAASAKRVFEPLAAEKGLRLVVEIAPGLPPALTTDQQRVERILVNLLGNAIKFTDRGEVALRIGRPAPGTRFERPELSPESTIAFAVSDTGIGIAKDAQERVFAPFEQVESHSHRRYAGTGLGLAIARESALLLGGELGLDSAPGRGSTFTCYLPEGAAKHHKRRGADPEASVADDRAGLVESEPHLLIIEDDPVLAEQLVDIIHARRLKVVVANTGQEGLTLARKGKPIGIILDVKLPDIDGWAVMERLSQDTTTRSIPVHFVSAVDAPERGLSLGALGYLTKPATRGQLSRVVRTLVPSPESSSQRILVVEDSEADGAQIVRLLTNERLEAHRVTSAEAALAVLERERFACMILDLGLPDMDGLSLLEALRRRPEIVAPPVVVHTGRALTKRETRELEAYAETIILKGGASAERLLDELRLFVRHLKESFPTKPPADERHGIDVSLLGTTIMLVEDDIRTVYAISALLRGKGAEVIVAENGREALELLGAHPDVNGVLMDIMMPEMDGYEAMRHLRRDARFSMLPVIALTAKAMKGERERCLEAGATEYLTKPVNGEQLLTTLATLLRPAESNGFGRTS